MATEGILIGLDWGTTNVRAALLGADGQVLEQRRSTSGVGHFTSDEFAARFDDLTKDWPTLPALAAGMIGSRQGWHEADYLPCPTQLNGLGHNLARFEHKGQVIGIVPGLKMETENRCDVMRGEETQIAGFLAQNPTFCGTLVMPGTHSKWVRVNQGGIEQFTTYLTGDLFNALSSNSILRHSVEGASDGEKSDFQTAFRDVLMAKGSNYARLFNIRASTLLKATANESSREKLSGLLIGMEFEAAAQDGYDVENFVIIGAGGLTQRYALAGEALSAKVSGHDGTELVWPALLRLAADANLLGN